MLNVFSTHDIYVQNVQTYEWMNFAQFSLLIGHMLNLWCMQVLDCQFPFPTPSKISNEINMWKHSSRWNRDTQQHLSLITHAPCFYTSCALSNILIWSRSPCKHIVLFLANLILVFFCNYLTSLVNFTQ